MKTITFYSYKGSVGRSLALANIANRLAEFGKKVCMIDFDLEAPGLHIKFGGSIGKGGIKKGLVDYIHKFTSENVVPENISDFVTDINSFNKGGGKISLIAAGNTSSEEYWKKLSHISWTKLFYEKDSVGVDFFFNLKAQIEKQIAPDVLLIDSRTGITDIAGVTMSIMADEVVLFAANNMENIEGIGQVLCSLAVPSNTLRNKMPKINIVLSRIPYFTNPKDKPRETNAKNTAIRIFNEALTRKAIDSYRVEKVFVIHSEPELEMQEEIRIHRISEDALSNSTAPITADYLELFEELTADMISQDEATALDNFKKAGALMDRAMITTVPEERIKLLTEAIAMYPRFYHAYLYLGIAYLDIGQYTEALKNFNKAERLSPQFADTIEYFKAHILYNQGKLDEAKVLYENQVNKGKGANLVAALNMLGVIYQRERSYERSIEYYKRAIAEDPENPNTWNGYANSLRIFGYHDEGFEAVYRSLELDPQHILATTTLAELNASVGNYREFYKNIDLAFSLGLSGKDFQKIVVEDDVYRQFANDEKFQIILEKYGIEVDLGEQKG